MRPCTVRTPNWMWRSWPRRRGAGSAGCCCGAAAMPELAWPWVFALLPLPWLCRRLLPPAAPARALRLPLDDASLLVAAGRVSRGHAAILAVAWLLLLTAAARPQWVGPPQPVTHSGRSMMLAVDISGSMAIRDMRLDDE